VVERKGKWTERHENQAGSGLPGPHKKSKMRGRRFQFTENEAIGFKRGY